MKRFLVVFCLGVLLSPAASTLTRADDAAEFPVKLVKIVVPFPAGGINDILARIVAETLHATWGQSVIVENRPGAGGNIGADLVAQAEPDGYTLLAAPPGPLAINQSLYRKLSYDSTKFVPITVLGSVPNVIVAGSHVPVNSVGELIEYAKKNPGKLTFASQGNGSTSHLTGDMFQTMTGVTLVHIPYKGEGPALTDMLGGHVDLMFGNLSASLAFHRAGKVKILAVAGPRRAASLPDVPTADEAGLPGFHSVAWFAMVAPPGTSEALSSRINRAVVDALATTKVRTKFQEQGVEPVGNSPAEMAAFVGAERERWRKIIRQAGVTVD
jgi:tripartite-type tricarboxylate transporter receptor subunit TctC